MALYFPFTPATAFSGTQSSPVPYTGQGDAFSGTPAQPGAMVKLQPVEDWAQLGRARNSLTLLGGALTLENLRREDWTAELRSAWVLSYVQHCGFTNARLGEALNQELLGQLDRRDFFRQLSGVSVAYALVRPESGEVWLGVNTYSNPWLRELLAKGSRGSLQTLTGAHHGGEVLVSGAVRATYQGFTHIMWAFGGTRYRYTLPAGAAPTLTTGGGDRVGEIRFAGSAIRANYQIRRRVDPEDPTLGLYSGEGPPFSVGEPIVVADISCRTRRLANSDWTWVGDLTLSPKLWHVADITNPCHDYRYFPVDQMPIPLQAFSDCTFEDVDPDAPQG